MKVSSGIGFLSGVDLKGQKKSLRPRWRLAWGGNTEGPRFGATNGLLNFVDRRYVWCQSPTRA